MITITKLLPFLLNGGTVLSTEHFRWSKSFNSQQTFSNRYYYYYIYKPHCKNKSQVSIQAE